MPLTHETYQQVTAAAVTLILIVLFLWPRNKKAKAMERDISSAFAYLKAGIMCAENKKQLGFYKTRVEHFFDKYYCKVSKPVLQRYYARLLETIDLKEKLCDEAAKKAPAA